MASYPLLIGLLLFVLLRLAKAGQIEGGENEIHSKGGHGDNIPPPTSYQSFNLISKNAVAVKIPKMKKQKMESTTESKKKTIEWMSSPALSEAKGPTLVYHPIPAPPNSWVSPAATKPASQPAKKTKSSPPKKWQPSQWD